MTTATMTLQQNITEYDSNVTQQNYNHFLHAFFHLITRTFSPGRDESAINNYFTTATTENPSMRIYYFFFYFVFLFFLFFSSASFAISLCLRLLLPSLRLYSSSAISCTNTRRARVPRFNEAARMIDR